MDFAKGRERGGVGVGVETVLGGQKHRSSREHRGRVIEYPRVIEGDEVVDCLRHKRMPFFGEYEVIGNANRYRFREDNWVHEEGVEGAEAADVQIDVHAAIVVEDEIANGIGPPYRVGVGVECVEKPGIVLGYDI